MKKTGFEKGMDKGNGKEVLRCAHTGKRGHDASRCWARHPEHTASKHAYTVEHCNCQTDFAEGKGISVCCLERDTAVRETAKSGSGGVTKAMVPTPTSTKDRFDYLSDGGDVGGIEVLVPDR